MLEFTELEQQLIGKLGDAGVAEEMAAEWLGDIITARVQQATEESLTGALHPEFGTEWREPNGIIWKAIQQEPARADAAEAKYDALVAKVGALADSRVAPMTDLTTESVEALAEGLLGEGFHASQEIAHAYETAYALIASGVVRAGDKVRDGLDDLPLGEHSE